MQGAGRHDGAGGATGDAGADLWSRLARLGRCCELSTTAVRVPGGGAGERLVWAVVLRQREEPRLAVRAQAEDLMEALAAAARAAAARGWPDRLLSGEGP